jgi:heavy metal translocating P-type ATPase
MDDHVEDVSVDRIAAGDLLLVRSGEVLPADGRVASADAMLDESALTGEPIPVLHSQGDAVRSGAVNAGETFHLRATASAGESTYAGILRLVTSAQTARAPFLRMADRYALLLLPVSLLVAGVAWVLSGDVVRALAVLVAATPCPLILAAPVAFIAGVSQAARLGILVKGGGPLEALAHVRTIIFDKTGTLTVGGAQLISITTAPDVSESDVLRLATCLEQASHHVIARSIVHEAHRRDLNLSMPEHVRETHGSGLVGRVDGHDLRIGSCELVFGQTARAPWVVDVLQQSKRRSALAVFVARDGEGIGALLMGDEVRAESPQAVARLRRHGIRRLLMLTGDRADAAEPIGTALDLDLVLADCTPAEKLDVVSAEQKRAAVLMVGDGINDAPALAVAHVGMAMGARGASASSQAADIVVLVDRIDRVADAYVIAKRTRAIAWQSIAAGMAFSAAAMVLAAFGFLSPLQGALVQEAIDVAVILNALRALVPASQA